MRIALRDRPVVVAVGKDARTDALVHACSKSARRPRLFAVCDYEHAGLRQRCEDVLVNDVTNVPAIVAYAKQVGADLAIVGPEEPLAAGLVDALDQAGIKTFGPRKALARIEVSKAWARDVLDRHRIPGNPVYATFRESRGIGEYLRELGEFVVKPDGLTAGKGVRVSGEHLLDYADGVKYAKEVLAKHSSVTIEERLQGEEFSLQTITDGEAVLHCPAVQDHKRALSGDQGPNTGGMGSYSCADGSLPFLTRGDLATAQAINSSVVQALRAETGHPYRGVLYGGYIVTSRGVKVIEFNARFGDPEALNVLPLLRGDFVDLAFQVVEGRLASGSVDFDSRYTVCKYVVPQGYPQAPSRGEEIFEDTAVTGQDCLRYFAGVELHGHQLYLTGSRAVAFVGVADDLAAAESAAERGAASIKGNVTHRADVGTSGLVARRVEHMKVVREQHAGAAR